MVSCWPSPVKASPRKICAQLRGKRGRVEVAVGQPDVADEAQRGTEAGAEREAPHASFGDFDEDVGRSAGLRCCPRIGRAPPRPSPRRSGRRSSPVFVSRRLVSSSAALFATSPGSSVDLAADDVVLRVQVAADDHLVDVVFLPFAHGQRQRDLRLVLGERPGDADVRLDVADAAIEASDRLDVLVELFLAKGSPSRNLIAARSSSVERTCAPRIVRR